MLLLAFYGKIPRNDDALRDTQFYQKRQKMSPSLCRLRCRLVRVNGQNQSDSVDFGRALKQQHQHRTNEFDRLTNAAMKSSLEKCTKNQEKQQCRRPR